MSRRPYTPGIRAIEPEARERLDRELPAIKERFPVGWWFRPYDGVVAHVEGYHATHRAGWQLRVRYHSGERARLWPLDKYIAQPPKEAANVVEQ